MSIRWAYAVWEAYLRGALHPEATAEISPLRLPGLAPLCAKRTSAHPISKLVPAPRLMRLMVGCVMGTPSAVRAAAISDSLMPDLFSLSTIDWGVSSITDRLIRSRIEVHTPAQDLWTGTPLVQTIAP